MLLTVLTTVHSAFGVPTRVNDQGRVVVSNLNFNGAGSFKFALVNGSGSETYWGNDGTSTNGSEPTASVALTVTKGLFPVQLGGSGMDALPAAVFENDDVRLRVWFNGGSGSQQLLPDMDGQSNAYEYVVNTVPTNKDSLFQFTLDPVTGVTAQLALSLDPTFTSRNYQVEWKTDLSNAVWNALVLFIESSNGLTRVFRDTNAPSDKAFYRARIELSP